MDIVFGWHLDGTTWPAAAGGNVAGLGQPVVGPMGLLGLLEMRFGLGRPQVAEAVRIAQYQARLRGADDGNRFYSRSLAKDSWATARTVLSWRDDLMTAGWTGGAVEGGGGRLEAMAAVERTGLPLAPSSGERLAAVLGALTTRAPLGIGRLSVAEPADSLPPRWRLLVERLAALGVPIETRLPEPAATGGDLELIQRALAGRPEGRLTGDGSLVVLDAGDEWQAADVIATWLRAGNNSGTVLVRGKGAGILDSACAAQGLPRPGVTSRSPWRGALQVLPLFFETLWTPLDAARMLEFLSLPALPLPRFVARRFAEAFASEPGIGGEAWSKAWHKARAEFAARQEDRDTPEAKKEQAKAESGWEAWLKPQRFCPEEGMPATVARSICQRLAQWAAAQGEISGNGIFRVAAGQALALAEAISAGANGAINRVQLGRMIDAVTGDGAAIPGGNGEAAPWTVIDHPGRLWQAADIVLWWGLSGAGAGMSPLPWRSGERAALVRAGIQLEEPEQAVLREAAAWRNAVLLARSRLVLVMPRAHLGETAVAHPLWHELRVAAKRLGGIDRVKVAAATIAMGATTDLAGRRLDRVAEARRPLPQPRRDWGVAPGVVAARLTESFSSIDKLIRCPRAWALTYAGHLRRGAVLQLPNDDQLIGTLAHGVIADMLPRRMDWSPTEAAAEAVKLFDRLAPAQAAPLLRPGNAVEYRRARRRVAEAVSRLVLLLRDARLSLAGTEVEAEVPFGAGTFTGAIDLLLKDDKGRSVILDLKWTKADKHRRAELADGRALQLAAYAWLERQQKRKVAGAGYFMLRQASLLYSEPDPFPAGCHVSGSNLTQTWQEMVETYQGRMAQLADGTVVARGIEPDIPSSAPLPLDDVMPFCRYCDFQGLCGGDAQ